MAWRLKNSVRCPGFASLNNVFQLRGALASDGPMGDVIRVVEDGAGYFVKRYRNAGGRLRNWLGTPRVERERRNLELFREWGLPVPEVVAAGYQRRWGRYRRGALITREIPGSNDLASLAQENSPLLRDSAWVDAVSVQVAHTLRVMHAHRFCHGDMKWRNILVTSASKPRVFLIDCPAGTFWFGPFLRYRVVKDLACLDKVGKQVLSRTQRLRFYLRYLQQDRLRERDRRQLRKVLSFFRGRE